MHKIIVSRFKNSFIPATDQSEKEFEKIKFGIKYSCTIKRARNPEFHNLIFGLAKIAIANTPEDSYWHQKTPYDLIKALMLEAGIVDFVRKFNGEVVAIPKSIAFENMDNDEFEPIADLMFYHTARIIKVDEDYLRKNYKTIFREYGI